MGGLSHRRWAQSIGNYLQPAKDCPEGNARPRCLLRVQSCRRRSGRRSSSCPLCPKSGQVGGRLATSAFKSGHRPSLDHLVVACEFRRQHFEAERPLTGVRFVVDRRQFLGVRAQYPLRTARRVWRIVVRATQTPLTRVLPAPQAAATCVITPFFASINRPDARQLRPVALAQLSRHIIPQAV